jgi:hypothetical protein
MHVLAWLGVLFIVAWLILWLGLKLTFAAIHIIVALGVILLIIGLVRGLGASKT